MFGVTFATARPNDNYGVIIGAHTSGACVLSLHATARTTAGFSVSAISTAPAASTEMTFAIMVFDQ
jgi:hypothetical protein